MAIVYLLFVIAREEFRSIKTVELGTCFAAISTFDSSPLRMGLQVSDKLMDLD